MTNWLLTQSLPLSLVLAALLLAGPVLQRFSGAVSRYRLWLVAPATLGVCQLASLFTTLPTAHLQHYWIQGSQHLGEAFPTPFHFPWLALWGLGFTLLAAVGLVSHWRFAKSHLVSFVTTEIPLPKSLSVLSCEGLSSPLLSGPFPTRLLLPADFQKRYSPAEQRLILSHELCHWQRGDLWWNLLALAVLLLFWFNPLCWLAYRRYRRDQELACDQAVLANSGKATRLAYGKALLKSLEGRHYQGPTLLNYIDKDSMMERLIQLQKITFAPRWHKAVVALFGLVLSGGVALAAQDNSSEPIQKEQPRYPVKAAKNGTTGFVVINMDITPEGLVANPRVVQSEPNGVFDKSALRAIAKWHYKPSATGQKNVQVKLEFAMDKDAKTTSANARP
ncbi:M56 family metallopeptidase [Gallaecimonas mangrovi]|uniref:M56 family metallopeptidase n=1 Tax=Gallaecimonas mangrovi TaxID=2291597 RepID=UPI000E1FEF74|nr:M56 family metallopeptidase [Gallaecimonas mangrovi]